MSHESALAMLNTAAATAAPTAPVVSAQSPGLSEGTAAPAQTANQTAGPGVKEPQLDSTRFNHLAKKESELQKQREAFKKEHETFTAERAKLTDVQNQIKEYERLKATDPVAALKSLGFSETDLFNFMSQASEAEGTPAEQATKAAQAEIKKFQDEQKAQADAASKAAGDQALAKFKSDITSHIASDKDKYEYCNHYGPVAEDLIVETVTAVLNESKELISVQEATDMVEQYYEDQDKLMSSMKKRQPREIETVTPPAKDGPNRAEVSPRPSTPAIEPAKVAEAPAPKAPAAAPKTPAAPPKRETPEEKRERLINKLASFAKQ